MNTPSFILSRTFEAPRSLLWKAWTDPDALKQWFGHAGSVVTLPKHDPRPGGETLYQLKSDNFPEMWGKFAYREVLEPTSLVYVNSFSNAEGGLTRHPLSDTWPLELLTTLTFEEADGKTTMTLAWQPLPSTPENECQTFDGARSSMEGGWGGTLKQLEAYLDRTQRTIGTGRLIDAPRDLVFKAWTQPEHVAKWWGPNGFTNTVTEYDLRPDGDWRLIMHGPDGTDYQNHWIFREITPQARIVLDHVSDPKFHSVATFEDRDGKTYTTFSQEFETVAICNALKPICEPSNEQNIDRLEAHLKTMR